MQGQYGYGPGPSGPNPGFMPVVPREQELPYFDRNSQALRIPPGQRGFELKAYPVSDNARVSEEEIKKVVQEVFRKDMKNMKNAAKDVKSPDGKSIWEMISAKVREEIRQGQRSEEKSFNNMWFELKPNTFSTAIWALIVLDFDALNFGALTQPCDSEYVPFSQRWYFNDTCADYVWYPINYWMKRVWPLLSAGMFLFVGIFLFLITIGVQFGFTYLLYNSLEMPDFKVEGVEYICATTGWLQIISIGFFVAYMLGELPRLIKVFFLIWFSEYETSVDRGNAERKKLWIDKEEGAVVDMEKYYRRKSQAEMEAMEGDDDDLAKHEDSEDDCHVRSLTNLRLRKFFATIVNLADVAITGFVLFVGVRYIFWSGYKSLDPSYMDDKYAPWNEDGGFPDGGFPWMTNTNGIEEVIMATLALVFIMDVDELLFSFLLPRAVQQVVEDCRLSSVMWMPSSFDADDFRHLGMPMDASYELFHDFKRKHFGLTHSPHIIDVAEDFIAEYKDKDAGNVHGHTQRNVHQNTLNEALKKVFEKNHKALQQRQLKNFTALRDRCVEFQTNFNKHGSKNLVEKADEDKKKAFKEELDAALDQAKDEEMNSNFNGVWMKIMPFTTVCWMFLLIAIGCAIVLMVRHYEGCAHWSQREMPEMPMFRNASDMSDGEAYSTAVIPSGVVFVVLVGLLIWDYSAIWERKFPGRDRDTAAVTAIHWPALAATDIGTTTRELPPPPTDPNGLPPPLPNNLPPFPNGAPPNMPPFSAPPVHNGMGGSHAGSVGAQVMYGGGGGGGSMPPMQNQGGGGI